MTDIAAMLNAYPGTLPSIDDDALVICVQYCLNCAQACTSCADACAADPGAAHLVRCSGAVLNCADLATAAVRVLSRPTPYDAEVTAATLRALIEACRAAYDECRKHALENEACRICGDACRRCAQACRRLLRPLE
ncbi:hypothetical protein Val02_74440 [Virgisporangium aliadipatigenens]|uniref:Four-helix bundle copper-binding protein n=1 Tax=Virgisporangium aliadipatigenens TaxID=741659 RepID=A0A8J3YVN8_9ACTN|nr:four-helix bundle copper-binding protein [Virgisporangium aliadipatigenens]GIJ50558.1 hypothetical protein Val02_74440 [Virgisporangium aliadipatigenens]